MHALMSSLSGTGSVELGDGQIKGIDLAAMMRNLKNAFGGFEGATDFTSLTGTFEMDRGVLQNVDLSLVSPLFRAGGRGSIDVGARAMNYEVTPMRLAEGAEFTVPVMITGPWNNLRFRPDLEALADLLLNSDFENSEELRRAREKLQEVRAVLDDPEAAIEDRLRKELERKLLGGIGTPPVAQPDTTGDETAALTPAPEAASQSLEDTVKDGVRNRLLEELGLRREPEAAPEAQQLPVQTPQAGAGTGSGSPLALSTPGTRPRLRPAGLDTSATPLEASVDTVGTEATVQPEPEPDTRSGEERLKDAVEDAAKNELRKLLGLGE